MNEIPPPGIPLDLYSSPLNAVRFLRQAGHPDDLARMAERMDAFAEIEPYAARLGGHFRTAADLARLLEGHARTALETLSTWHMEYDFDQGTARLPGGKRTLEPSMIVAALAELYPERKLPRFDRETYEAVRGKLAEIFGPEGAGEITDGQIRGAIQRRYKSNR